MTFHVEMEWDKWRMNWIAPAVLDAQGNEKSQVVIGSFFLFVCQNLHRELNFDIPWICLQQVC